MKILLIEDHPVFRDGLTHVLRGLEANVQFVEAASAEEALAIADENSDIAAILLDLNLSGRDGLAALPTLRAHYPGVPVLIVSASEGKDDVRRAMRAGALGYVAKSSAPDVLLAAVRAVLAGTVYVPTVMLREEAQAAGAPAGRAPDAHALTAREMEVLRLVSAGASNKSVARALGISDGTVRIHLTSIFRTLGVASRTQAIVVARRQGMIDD